MSNKLKKKIAKMTDYNEIIEIAKALESKNSFSSAILYYERALEIQEDDPLIWYSLGLIYSTLRQQDNAIHCLKRAIDLKDNFTDAWFKLSIIYALSEKNDEALESIKRALDYDESKPEYWDFYGVILSMRNDCVAAINQFKKAIELDESYLPAHENLREAIAEKQLKEK